MTSIVKFANRDAADRGPMNGNDVRKEHLPMDSERTSTMSTVFAGSARWQSPELAQTPNEGLGAKENEMKSFVEQYLVSLLRPTSQHIRELQDTVSDLKTEVRKYATAQNTSCARIDQHGKELVDIRRLATDTGQKIRLSRDEFTKKVDQSAKHILVKLDETHSKCNTHIDDVAAKLERLQGTVQAIDGNVGTLQENLRGTKDHVTSLAGGIKKIEDCIEGWRHEHLGLCERINQTRTQGTLSQQQLRKLETKVEGQNFEFTKNFARLDKHAQELERGLTLCEQSSTGHMERLEACNSAVKMAKDEASILREELSLGKKSNVAILQKLDAWETMAFTAMRLDKDVAQLQKEFNVAEHVVRDLASQVQENKEKLDRHAGDIGRIEPFQLNLYSECKDLANRFAKSEDQQVSLEKRANSTDTSIRQLQAFQTDSTRRLDALTSRSEQTDSRLCDTERRIFAAETGVTSLNSEMAASGEVVRKTAMDIDLAHEYLHGMSKGFQQAHEQVLHGRNEMLPYKKGAPQKLPSMPTSRPQSASVGGRRRPVQETAGGT
mmetsp:Transcript_76019/g.211224  ORF Transcript_76019/g.211224 Transcript_76019/m.211224 type:complete len:551 (-) Transcript_76019:117-1769(-)